MIDIPFTKIKELCERYTVKRLLLFSSALREDFNSTNDIDLLVEYPSIGTVNLLDMASLQYELSAIFERPIDLITPNSIKPRLREPILNTARVIYEQ